MENNQAFSYTYSASQQQEVQHIRQKYMPKEADKLAQLRILDSRTTRPGCIAALIIGTISALVLGVGMCCTMVWQQFFAAGIFIGIIGIIGICITYPIYLAITKHQRQKLAPQIMQLSQELMANQ